MKNYEQIVAIDHGYDSVKVFDGKRMFSFKSRIEEVSTDNNFVTGNNTYEIQYDGKNYIVGEGASTHSIDYDKTDSENNKIFTLLALSRLAETSPKTFNVVAGYPLNLYSKNKNIFAKYLQTSKYKSVIVDNGDLQLIEVADSLVFPQGAGALFANAEHYKDRLVAILDIGGVTVNGCIFNNLNLQVQSMFTVNLGCMILLNKIRKELNNQFTLNLQDYEMYDIIQHGLFVDGKRQSCDKLIDDIIFQHCQSIKNECKKFNWNVETLNIVIVGGGGLLLDGYIQNIIPQAEIMTDPVYANVKGFYEVGRQYYAKNI